MTESFCNIEDEAFPSYLSASVGSSRATLGNVTLASTLGLPVAASTMAKIRAGADNRVNAIQASYLEDDRLSLANSQSSNEEQGKFALSFKDDLDDADDFIAAHRFSDMLVKVNLDEKEPRTRASALSPNTQTGPLPGRHSEHRDDLSTGLVTFTHLGNKDFMDLKVLSFRGTVEDQSSASDGADSDHFSGSVSSFLANEKLMSVDSMNSDVTDEEMDVNDLQDEELDLYFNKLVNPAMQRGRVEGQEIPVTEFQMPAVRLAATGMDSCPGSGEEDTEDELEASRRHRLLLTNTSRQLVGESNRPSFRPGLEGGSSDDEAYSGRNPPPPPLTGIEHRHSAEGQVINTVTGGGGGGGDGSSGSEEGGNDGVSTLPLSSSSAQTTYDVLRGLGIVGEENAQYPHSLLGLSRGSLMGDRVGPVGTGENISGSQRMSPVNWSMSLDRQEVLVLPLHSGLPVLSDTSQGEEDPLSTSLEAKYLSQGFHQEDSPHSDSDWNHCPDNLELEFQPASHSVVYQNEEGKWVTDLAYYSSFEKEVDGNQLSEEVAVQFQAEDFVPGSNAIEKIIKDQKEFEEENQFMQEEVMEPASTNPSLLADTSWRLPASSHILMRASQVSQELDRGNQSYLRLSLGTFFQQRSEALGCLGDDMEDDTVKRPSFGYVITSPKKREPFPLIRPSDFLSQDSSVQNDTLRHTDHDHTMNTEDLDETVEAAPDRVSPKGDEDPEPCESASPLPEALLSPSQTLPSASPSQTLPSASPGSLGPSPGSSHSSGGTDQSNLMLSISTIASAMADASISSDPSQLAAMIMELSKRSRRKSQQQKGLPGPAPASVLEEKTPSPNQVQLDQSTLLETLQRSQCAGDLSAFDIEKYLKQTELSTSSDSDQSGSSHYTFEVLTRADSLNSSHRKSQAASLLVTLDNGSSGYQHQVSEYQASTKGDISSSSGVETQGYPAATAMARPFSAGLHPGSGQSGADPAPANKTEVRRSSIPRPRASSIPKASCNPERRSVGSGQFSSTSSSTAKLAAHRKAAGSTSDPQPAGALSRNSTESGAAEQGAVHPTPNNTPAQKVEDPSPAHAPGPKTSPGLRKGRSGPPSVRGTTPPSQRSRSTGSIANTHGTGSSSAQQKKPSGLEKSLGTAPHSAVVKHVGFTSACHSPQPAAAHRTYDVSPGTPVQHAGGPEQSQCTFRPSTSPLTHSSPSQTSFPSQEGTGSPSSSVGDRRPPSELTPTQSLSHSEWSCSSPSLSRLTYVSLNDSTALNSTGIPTPNRHKSNGTMALSTTIIRASPTPPVEQADTQSHTGQDLPLNRSTVVLCPPRGLSSPHCHQSKSPESPQHSNSPRSGSADLRSGSGLGWTHSQSNFHCGNNRDYKQKHSESKVDSGFSSNLKIQQPSGMGLGGQVNQQLSGVSAQGSEVYPGTGTGFGLPSSEDLCYMPISSFKPQGSIVDLPPGVPTLLTGSPLFSSQLAQQNLGSDGALHPGPPLPAPYHNIAAAGNYLYGHTMSSGLVPNVDPSVRRLHSSGGLGVSGPGGPGGPGVLYPGQLHCSDHHHKPLDPGLMVGYPYKQHCVSSWANGSLPELTAQVVMPEELRFPHACCVGISSQTSLGIFNPSERWQQVSITVTSLAIDGEKVDSFPYQWLIVKNQTIIGPKSTEEQKVLFIPPQAGVYQAVLSVSSWPASAEAEAVARAEVFAKRVVLIAMAENPALEVDVGKCGSLDFGDLAGGSAKALPLKLLNRTHATVPVRLVISANATAWRCFTFSKSPVAMTAEGLLQAGTVTSLASTSVMNHVMHASYGENPESFMVWVHFHAPQKYQPCSEDLGPADEYSARVDIEVDCPGPSHVIRSIPLKARSGTARVHAPKDLQTVYLSAPFGQSSKQTLPLKNAGNIDVQLKLKNSGGDDCFCVSPDELCLRAGEEQGIVVSFTSQDGRKNRESVLTILVLPSGPQYEVVLKGQVVPEEGGKPTASALGMLPPSEVPPILSNKQFMAWGGVTLGRAVQQKLVLRNNSPNTTHQLRLLIRGQDHNCFQLQSNFGLEERLTRHRELSIRPREDVVVYLLFAPTQLACALAKLEIKQSGVRPSQPGIKFTIPLSGYGGTSNIVLEDHRKHSDGYEAMLMGVAAGKVSKLCVCVRNTGSRAAFIKAVPYSDLQTRSLMDSSGISLSPSQFVLKERTQEVITFLMKVTQREQTLCQSANALLATVCLFCGDEVSRQQFRRLLLSKPEAGKKILSENSLLKGLHFNQRFLGEEQVLEAYDLPQSPNQAQLFYGSLRKVVLSVLGSAGTCDSGERDLHVQPPLAVTRRGSEADSGCGNSDRHISNVSLDVLPVKGPQGPALPRTEASQTGTEPGDHRDSWSLQPEQLVLTSPTINGASYTRHVQIHNHSSSRELSFELSWPAHCLTVTPQHGVIEPQCHLQILISPNPSLATRCSTLPWSGQIYVQCDNQQKFIKIQIRQDLALDVSTDPADRSLASLLPQTDTPMSTTMLPPAGRPPQTLTREAPATVEISNRTIVFPATPSGDTSESSVEVENRGEQVRWYLSSFAPPYVKGVDSSGDVYRATYTAFRCPRVSGTLGAHHKMQVPITFLPRDRGDYAQFWDLECHPVAEPQHKTRIRFQLCGTGVKVGSAEAPEEADCSLVKTEATFKTRRRPEPAAAGGMTGQEEALGRGVYSPQDLYCFPSTRVGETSTLKVNMRNNSSDTHGLRFLTPREPFHIKHSKYSLRSQRYIHLPVQFKPVVTGHHSSLLLVQTDTSGSLSIQLTGEALP